MPILINNWSERDLKKPEMAWVLTLNPGQSHLQKG